MLHPPVELLQAEIPLGHKLVKGVTPVDLIDPDLPASVGAAATVVTVRQQIKEILAAEPDPGPEKTTELEPVSRPRSRPPNRWGVGALVFAGLAIALASVPALNGLSIPLAGLAAILGIRGLSSPRPRQSGRFLPAVGLATASAVIAIFVLAPSFFGRRTSLWPSLHSSPAPTLNSLTVGQPSSGSRPIESSVSWIQADKETVRLGDIRVRLVSVKMQKSQANTKQSAAQEFRITLRVRNIGASREVAFPGWNAATDGGGFSEVALSDDEGHPCAGKSLAIKGATVLRPGKFLDEVLVFAAPAKPVEFLRLELPAQAIGGKGALRLQIPKKIIVRG
jgi:hypothetical protein